MQTLASPCAGQVRLRWTLEGIPPLRHTSAGHAWRQTGQREVVRLMSESRSSKAADDTVEFNRSAMSRM